MPNLQGKASSSLVSQEWGKGYRIVYDLFDCCFLFNPNIAANPTKIDAAAVTAAKLAADVASSDQIVLGGQVFG